MNRLVIALVTVALAACGSSPPPVAPSAGSGSSAGPGPGSGSGAGSGSPAVALPSVISEDILAREPLANTASVKHILISWNDLADAYGGRIDPRAAKRTKADAEAEVRSVVQQLASGADFDTLMKAKSEDTGSANNARAFTVTPDAGLVIEFRQLSLRLRVGEIGVVQSDFGFHIIKRIS